MHLPTAAHLIYIPALLVLGIVVGFVLGSRAARDAMLVEQRKTEERARRRAERRPGAAEAGAPGTTTALSETEKPG